MGMMTIRLSGSKSPQVSLFVNPHIFYGNLVIYPLFGSQSDLSFTSPHHMFPHIGLRSEENHISKKYHSVGGK